MALTYYVDGVGGLDSNNGLTPGTAWQTIAKVNGFTWTVQGTNVLFAGGQSFSGTLTPSNGLAAATPLIIGSYGTGNATINGGASGGFYALNMGGITVQDLVFLGNGGSNASNGVWFSTTLTSTAHFSGVSVLRCTVSGFGQNGIIISNDVATGTSGYLSPVIDGCVVFGCTFNSPAAGTAGILMYGNYGLLTLGAASHFNVVINNCLTYNNLGKAGFSNSTGSGIMVSEVNGCVIQYCTSHHNGSASTAGNGPVGIWCFDAIGVTIQFCESHHNDASGTNDGDGIDLDGGNQNCTVQYCYSHDNGGSGIQVYAYNDAAVLQDTNKVVRFCIAQNNGKAGRQTANIVYGSGSTRAQSADIYNNTSFSDGTQSLGCLGFGGGQMSGCTGHVANNILYSINNAPLITTYNGVGNPSGIVVVGNDYYNTGTFSIIWNGTTYTTFAAFQTATGQEKVAAVDVHLAVDPQLLNPGAGGSYIGYNPNNLPYYTSKSGSPIFGAGQNLLSLYSINVGAIDYFGNRALQNGSSIGADSAFIPPPGPPPIARGSKHIGWF